MAASLGNEDGDPGFQIAPMVDVVFVLLLFFMATVGAQMIREVHLPALLPSIGENHGQPVVVNIDIDPNGLVVMNDRVFGQPADRELRDLREWFSGVHERFGQSDPVILHPASEARQERIMDVLNACVAAKVANVSFR